MIKRGIEVRVKSQIDPVYARDLHDEAPYRWINNRKAGDTGKVAGPITIEGTQWILVVHVGELEAIYRPQELEEVE